MSNWGNQPSTGGKAGHTGTESHTSTNKGVSGPTFDSMYAQKRSQDPESVAKRENLAEQKPQGMIGKMWNKAMSGPGGPNPSAGQSHE